MKNLFKLKEPIGYFDAETSTWFWCSFAEAPTWFLARAAFAKVCGQEPTSLEVMACEGAADLPVRGTARLVVEKNGAVTVEKTGKGSRSGPARGAGHSG